MRKTASKSLIPSARIETMISVIRGQKVILDQDLATLYEVTTGRLNEQVRRNIDRFPEDFAFELTDEEWKALISQFAISNNPLNLKYQFGTSKKGRGGRRKLPIAFTEQGVAMLSSVLRSPQAVSINIEIMRAFIRMRYVMASHKELSKEVAELKSFLLKHSNSNDREFRRIWQTIEKLSSPPPHNERQIGFDTTQ